MTSFGASNVITDNYMPTCKIQGQIYHKVGSLLTFPDAEQIFSNLFHWKFKLSGLSTLWN